MVDVEEKIRKIIAKEGLVDSKKLVLEARLDELEIESIDLVNIIYNIEEEYDIYIPPAAAIKAVYPCLFLVAVLAPLASIASTTSRWPFSAAAIRAVTPVLLRASKSTRLVSSACTISISPDPAALISAVSPSLLFALTSAPNVISSLAVSA